MECSNEPLSLKSARIGFVGAGNMAQAIGEGLLSKGLVQPSQVIVSAPSDRNLVRWKELGVETTHSNAQVVDRSDIVFLAIKPQYLDEAIEGIKAFQHPICSKLYISILVGVTIEVLEAKLKGAVGNVRMVRAMPNTPMQVGEGCCVFCCGETTTQVDSDIVQTMLSSVGVSQKVPEAQINAVGGLAGSGPAYIYLVIEALSDGAVKQGVPRAMATQFAAQTVLGAAKMVLSTGKHPGQLKDEVCSPGGTTICGIHALERAGIRVTLTTGSPSEASFATTWTRKLWIRGSTLFQKKKSREGKEDQALPSDEEAAPMVDPTAIYKVLDKSYKLARIEEVGSLMTALRHLTRLQHPKGSKICFPVPEVVDRLQLRCANLPTDPEELLALVEKAYARRGEILDWDSLYRGFVMAHGRLAMDATKQFPTCYYETRHP